MPELPEVETVRRGLEKQIVSKTIINVHILYSNIIHNDSTFAARILNKKISSLRRRGKYILIDLDSATLLVHLRMTGKLLYNGCKNKHTHLILDFDDGSSLAYEDIRKFGRWLYLSTDELEPYLKNRVGIEPLAMTYDEFYAAVGSQKGYIKKVLLDQSVVAGLGNIYTDEILFASGLHPAALVQALGDEDYQRLFENCKKILRRAVETGGSSVKDYVNSLGQTGSFQLEHKVYGREGLPCYICKTPLQKIQLAGRGSVFCPKCSVLKNNLENRLVPQPL